MLRYQTLANLISFIDITTQIHTPTLGYSFTFVDNRRKTKTKTHSHTQKHKHLHTNMRPRKHNQVTASTGRISGRVESLNAGDVPIRTHCTCRLAIAKRSRSGGLQTDRVLSVRGIRHSFRRFPVEDIAVERRQLESGWGPGVCVEVVSLGILFIGFPSTSETLPPASLRQTFGFCRQGWPGALEGSLQPSRGLPSVCPRGLPAFEGDHQLL